MTGLLSGTPADKEYQRAVYELGSGNVLGALSRLEAALKSHDNAAWYSMLGFCIAKERGYLTKGEELCRDCIERQPEVPEHYYFLGRILLLGGRKQEALQVLRQGLARGDSITIKQLLQDLGVRKPPLFSKLHRDNPLNKYPGMVLTKLGLR